MVNAFALGCEGPQARDLLVSALAMDKFEVIRLVA